MRFKGTFAVDRANGKLAGVCAGLANYTGWDVTLIRVALVVGTLIGGFPWTLVAYGLAAWLAQPGALQRLTRKGRTADTVRREETRDRVRDLDRRMAEIEEHLTSSNSRLAREIEDLR